jgi:hypothetical protein
MTYASQRVDKGTSAMLFPAHHWHTTPLKSSTNPTPPVINRTRRAYPSSQPTCHGQAVSSPSRTRPPLVNYCPTDRTSAHRGARARPSAGHKGANAGAIDAAAASSQHAETRPGGRSRVRINSSGSSSGKGLESSCSPVFPSKKGTPARAIPARPEDGAPRLPRAQDLVLKGLRHAGHHPLSPRSAVTLSRFTKVREARQAHLFTVAAVASP